MRALPFGVPKVMVSTVAAGDMRAVVGPKDIIMVPSIVDVAGIAAPRCTPAAGAIAGMLGAEPPVTGQERLRWSGQDDKVIPGHEEGQRNGDETADSQRSSKPR